MSELVTYCMEETGQTEEECERDVFNENINKSRSRKCSKKMKKLTKSFGVNHASVTLIIGFYSRP